MADGDTYIDIGGKMSIASGKPATLDATGFAALSYTQIKGVLNIPENGDTAEDVSEPTLEDGRTEHFYGTKDGGGIDVPLKYIEGDAGQALVLSADPVHVVKPQRRAHMTHRRSDAPETREKNCHIPHRHRADLSYGIHWLGARSY